MFDALRKLLEGAVQAPGRALDAAERTLSPPVTTHPGANPFETPNGTRPINTSYGNWLGNHEFQHMPPQVGGLAVRPLQPHQLGSYADQMQGGFEDPQHSQGRNPQVGRFDQLQSGYVMPNHDLEMDSLPMQGGYSGQGDINQLPSFQDLLKRRY